MTVTEPIRVDEDDFDEDDYLAWLGALSDEEFESLLQEEPAR